MPNPIPSEDELAAARRIIDTAEAAARHLIAEAAVAAAKLHAAASNGHHELIRADIAGVKASVAELAQSVLGLQRASLRLFGMAGLAGGCLIFALSRVLGL